MQLEYHPLANKYPLLEGLEYEEFVEGIRKAGLIREKIVLYEGKILDGRNRWRAGRELGLPVPARDFDPEEEGDPELFVENANDDRRHELPEVRRKRKQARVEKVAELRREGASTREIADKVGISETQVRKDIKVATAHGCAVEPKKGKVTGKDGKTRTAKSQAKKTESAEAVPLADENGNDVEQAGEADQLYDQAEQLVPPQAFEAFNQLPTLRQLLSQMDRLAKEIEEVGKTPVGKKTHWQSAQSQVRAARKTLHAGRPAYVCPYCRGQKSDCTACHGDGWVTTATYEQAPPEMKEIRRNGKGGAK